MKIALDATYSLGRHLSGVGMYSRELLPALALNRPDIEWHWLYRTHKLGRALRERVPASVRRGVLLERVPWRNAGLFHGLNQRLPESRFPLQVATFHDLFVMTADYSTPEFRARFTAQAKRAAAQADRIIAVSKFTAKQVAGLLGVERSRISVIPHGVRHLRITPMAREPIVLNVGAIQKRKNLVRLVRAFEELPTAWRLVLAGSAGYGAEAVFEAIRKSTCAARITVTGYVTASNLAEWYSRASIFAFPSLDEGFGMPVLEAMSAGLPVLASCGSAVGEVAGEAALLVDPMSQDGISAKLLELVRNEGLREELVRRGTARAGEFSWSRAAGQTFQVYEELLASRAGR